MANNGIHFHPDYVLKRGAGGRAFIARHRKPHLMFSLAGFRLVAEPDALSAFDALKIA